MLFIIGLIILEFGSHGPTWHMEHEIFATITGIAGTITGVFLTQKA